MKHRKEKRKKPSPDISLFSAPRLPHALFNRAVGCLQEGDLDRAAALFKSIIKEDRKNSQAHYNLGLVHYRGGEFVEAEYSFQEAVRCDPANTDAQFNLGLLLSRTNRPAEAAECFIAVLKIDPGDVEARYNLGAVLKDLGLFDEAAGFFQEVVEINPDYGPAYSSLGIVRHIQGREKEAIAAYRRAISLGDDSPANQHILNALTGRQTECPPQQYVANLFDGYAPRFDESLVTMEYQIPMLLRRALDSVAGAKFFERAVDLGCGTGFSGLPFREKTGTLTGVDLSTGMLEVAAQKNIYDALHHEDILDFLRSKGQCYDLFVLTDVCVYLGRLDEVFAAVRQRAGSGALILFSIELGRKADVVLRSSGRYAHSTGYIKRLAGQNRMSTLFFEKTGVRRERGKWIEGVMYILRC